MMSKRRYEGSHPGPDEPVHPSTQQNPMGIFHPPTEPGFIEKWGPISLYRLISDPKFGYVIEIRTDAGKSLIIRSSPKGRRLTVEPQDTQDLLVGVDDEP